MKNIFQKSIMLAASLFVATSCGDDFLDVNTNPNKPTVSTPDLVLPSALYTSVKRVSVDLNVLGNLWVGNWTQATDFLFYGTQLTYAISPATYNGLYNEIFNQSLNDLRYIETASKDAGLNNYFAISKIMQGYNYLLLVDLWGDVPYDEALQGTNVLTPKYEGGEVVYDKALASIDAGIAAIDNSKTPGADDIYFNGDMDAWVKFANTLKLRAYLRLSDFNEAKSKQGVQSLATAEFIGAGESVLANPGFLKSTNKMSPFYEIYGYNVSDAIVSNNKATRAADFGMDFLKDSNDPRLGRLYSKPTGAAYKDDFRSIPSGTRETKPERTFLALSGIGPGILDDPNLADDNITNDGYKKSIIVLSSAESLLLQAEAVQRGWLVGDAQDLYEEAIKESFVLLEVEDAEAEAQAYYAQAIENVGWAASSDKIEAIITQKWVALNGINGIEAWNEYRRTGFPVGVPLSVTALTPKYPIRIPYAQDEFANNSVNVPKASTVYDLPIFWDTVQ